MAFLVKKKPKQNNIPIRIKNNKRKKTIVKRLLTDIYSLTFSAEIKFIAVVIIIQRKSKLSNPKVQTH